MVTVLACAFGGTLLRPALARCAVTVPVSPTTKQATTTTFRRFMVAPEFEPMCSPRPAVLTAAQGSVAPNHQCTDTRVRALSNRAQHAAGGHRNGWALSGPATI